MRILVIVVRTRRDPILAPSPASSTPSQSLQFQSLFVGGDAPVLSDLDGKAHGAYGLEGQAALVLIRPDGHIAFRGAADRPDLLAAYCRKAFGAEGGNPAPASKAEQLEAAS